MSYYICVNLALFFVSCHRMFYSGSKLSSIISHASIAHSTISFFQRLIYLCWGHSWQLLNRIIRLLNLLTSFSQFWNARILPYIRALKYSPQTIGFFIYKRNLWSIDRRTIWSFRKTLETRTQQSIATYHTCLWYTRHHHMWILAYWDLVLWISVIFGVVLNIFDKLITWFWCKANAEDL